MPGIGMSTDSHTPRTLSSSPIFFDRSSIALDLSKGDIDSRCRRHFRGWIALVLLGRKVFRDLMSTGALPEQRIELPLIQLLHTVPTGSVL